ncbi:MAG: polyphosphate:AMP phosphotransferase [Spirochaetales bacterium]|nr:polyphosphate:AMP phosphotransferase [Spirochaetales bacterium]
MKLIMKEIEKKGIEMLDKIDLGRKISKEDYNKEMNDLEIRLGALQRAAKDLEIPVIIVFEGWDAAGKGTLINNLILPMDPRGFKVFTIVRPNAGERYRPFLWRFWTKIPERGRISLFDTSWYRTLYVGGKNRELSGRELSETYNDIKAFESQLTNDGYLLIKFFLHISKNEQKNRMKKLEKDKATSWRVTKKDWKHHKMYETLLTTFQRMIEHTDTENAPWTIVESTDKKFATIKIFKTLIGTLDAAILRRREEGGKADKKRPCKDTHDDRTGTSVLDKINPAQAIDDEEYKRQLKACQNRIRELEYVIYSRRIPVIILFEGWDAAGKGGNIRRLTRKMDPRGYEVIPVSAPNDTEKAHHYLWRFWNKIPKAGHIAIFDRTWYGRVLVERVEGFCTEDEWKRAYKEINEMERHIVNFGTVLVKFWLQIDKDEQMRRFRERETVPYKKWKLTDEDWRNREKWDLYKQAVDEMLYRTSTSYAPWTIVESNSKKYARIKTLDTVITGIDRLL